MHFGDLKKHQGIQEYGMQYRDKTILEKIFHPCCILHNMVVGKIKILENTTCIRRGLGFVQNDTVYLEDAKQCRKDLEISVFLPK